jgi:hypothetical protein
METARIEEDGQSPWEAKIEDFDPPNEKGAFEASQFTESKGKLSVPLSQFKLTLGGKTYRCATLIATHFSIISEEGAASNKRSAATAR